MNDSLTKQLLEKSKPKDWDTLQEHFKSQIDSYHGEQPIYKFFETLKENLEINSKMISINVQPVNSYIPFHIHNYVEIIVPTKGSCVLETLYGTVQIQQDDIVIMGRNTPHTTQPISEGTLVVSIALRMFVFSFDDFQFSLPSNSRKSLSHMMFSILNENQGEGQYSIFKVNHQEKISQLIQDILSEYYTEDVQSSQIIHFSLLTLFSRLIRQANHSNQDIELHGQPENSFMSLLLYIEQHYSDITLESMAAHFGYHPNYLSSYLKKQTGMTFIKLVHLQRTNIAAEYLTFTNLTIDKISFKIGYENPSYFYKIFKKIMGNSPKKYRQQHQVLSTNDS